MKCWIKLGAVVLLLASDVEAGVRRGAVVRRTAATVARSVAAPARPVVKVAVERPLAIVPFAVPVAVPVAEFDPTGVFYGVHEFAARPARPAASESAARAEPSPSAEAVLRKHCAQCHTGGDAAGKLAMFGADKVLVEKLPRHVMWEMAAPGEDGSARMPPADRPRLSTEEL